MCRLHDGEDIGDQKVTIFNESTLRTCHNILEVRKAEGLKYQNIILPFNVDQCHGNHRECYGKFTALSKTQREKLKAKVEHTPTNPTPDAFQCNIPKTCFINFAVEAIKNSITKSKSLYLLQHQILRKMLKSMLNGCMMTNYKLK